MLGRRAESSLRLRNLREGFAFNIYSALLVRRSLEPTQPPLGMTTLLLALGASDSFSQSPRERGPGLEMTSVARSLGAASVTFAGPLATLPHELLLFVLTSPESFVRPLPPLRGTLSLGRGLVALRFLFSATKYLRLRRVISIRGRVIASRRTIKFVRLSGWVCASSPFF